MIIPAAANQYSLFEKNPLLFEKLPRHNISLASLYKMTARKNMAELCPFIRLSGGKTNWQAVYLYYKYGVLLVGILPSHKKLHHRRMAQAAHFTETLRSQRKDYIEGIV